MPTAAPLRSSWHSSRAKSPNGTASCSTPGCTKRNFEGNTCRANHRPYRSSEPGMRAEMALLETLDLRQVLQHEAHFVQTFQQPLLVDVIDLEGVRHALRIRDRL